MDADFENNNDFAVDAENEEIADDAENAFNFDEDDGFADEMEIELAEEDEDVLADEDGGIQSQAADGDVGDQNENINSEGDAIVNKSVLWDLEVHTLGNFFDKYVLADLSRTTRIFADIGSFNTFLDFIDPDIMSSLPIEEARYRITLCLDALQLHKTEYQQLMETVENKANDFRNCLSRIVDGGDKQRLDRAVVNHFLRMGYNDTAQKFASEREIQDLFNFAPFREAEKIVKALRNKDLGPAKAWCRSNAFKSQLDVQLTCQEYIEYVRSNERMVAITFAWKQVEELWDHKKELLPVLAAVAFDCDTPVLRYKKLFDEERWDSLIKLFQQHFYANQRLSYVASSLCILLESGIVALKVPFCFDGDDCKKDDPLQHEYFRTFASSLPHARHSFPPKLVCHVTKQALGEQNPPYMLPNGYAYSKQAISQMTNGEEVTCPRTGFVCNACDVRILKLAGYV